MPERLEFACQPSGDPGSVPNTEDGIRDLVAHCERAAKRGARQAAPAPTDDGNEAGDAPAYAGTQRRDASVEASGAGQWQLLENAPRTAHPLQATRSRTHQLRPPPAIDHLVVSHQRVVSEQRRAGGRLHHRLLELRPRECANRLHRLPQGED